MEEVIDLIKRTRPETLDKISEFSQCLSRENPEFKVGQKILFNGGYNNDLRFRSEITGFDEDGDIYVVWDCYWFPIRNEESRDIKIL